MIDAIGKIQQFTEDMDLPTFLQHEMAQFAVIKSFEILGEAAYYLSKAFKEKHPYLEWKKIEGLRHILVHDYYRINSELLWNTKENKLPELLEQLNRILEEKG